MEQPVHTDTIANHHPFYYYYLFINFLPNSIPLHLFRFTRTSLTQQTNKKHTYAPFVLFFICLLHGQRCQTKHTNTRFDFLSNNLNKPFTTLLTRQDGTHLLLGWLFVGRPRRTFWKSWSSSSSEQQQQWRSRELCCVTRNVYEGLPRCCKNSFTMFRMRDTIVFVTSGN